MNQKQTDITTGKQIRHLRTQSGMTQEELAGKLNVTRQALSNWERALERQAQAEKEVKAIVQKAKARAAGTAGGKTSGKAHRRGKA